MKFSWRYDIHKLFKVNKILLVLIADSEDHENILPLPQGEEEKNKGSKKENISAFV